MVTSPSPFASCGTAGASDTLYVNSAVEPSADVDPANPLHIAVGYQQDRWSGGGSRGLVAGFSFDGGLSWMRVPVPRLTACSGGDYERATDPWVSFAPNGDLYFFSMAFDYTTPPDRPGGSGKSAMLVSKSVDGGFTWSAPVKINRTPTSLPAGNRQAFTPTVSVAADGTIAVSYFDFRNYVSGSAVLATDYWIVHCHPTSTVSCTASADWVHESHVAGPFDMRQAPISRGYFLGDYMALPGIANRFKPVFVMSGPTAGRSSVFAADAAGP